MTQNPFANPAFATLGGQMVQMWQKAIDSWWSQLLGDSTRLGDLGRRLTDLGHGRSAGASQDVTSELGRVVQALELMDQRVSTLESQVREVAESVAVLVSVLGSSGAKAAGETQAAAGEGEPREPTS